ncbi:IS30 family transposase [Rhodococcus qingshengii]|uniref:IS30 family transposase n=1 Tax=Rhodococcus qingshengii TaxID=334542 RepID=UPI0024B94558|nr:IS30 family transposase [Rhodococcus qingshengii]MDJ0441096.1 IS30 family transposase [Rhodococcus qingshengii]
MAGKKYTDQQKEEFFRLLNRGGTVRAAARAVGVHENAGYNWLRKTGLTMARAAPRTYPAELKAEFLRLVREREIISTVAHELGIHRPTAYAWARKAGISTSEARKVNPRREEFLRLRSAGLTRVEARARVGADARSATDWDKGITIINRGRVYPDGRVVRYPVKNNDGVPERRTRAIGGSVDLNVAEEIIHPRYLSLLEREQLQDLRRAGLSIRAIASEMRRAPSTISRELKRNTISVRGYMPHTAHRLSVKHRARPPAGEAVRQCRTSFLRPGETGEKVVAAADQSPTDQGLSDHSGNAREHRDDLSGDLRPRPRRTHTRTRKATAPRSNCSKTTQAARRPPAAVRRPDDSISNRPAEVDSRKVPGHWEGDLIIGALGGSAIATLVERSSRFVMLGHLGRERTAEAVRDSLITTVRHLPASLRGTLTWDQGAEMAEHRAFATATNFDVYFADAGAPWQRGSNENTNGLLEWTPKVGHRI